MELDEYYELTRMIGEARRVADIRKIEERIKAQTPDDRRDLWEQVMNLFPGFEPAS